MRTITRRGIALGMLAGLVAVPASIPALAQDGAPANISHLQSVVTQLSETGEAGTSRVFTQLSVTGDGPVEVVLADQSTRGLRNLDGFGRPSTDGDSVIYGIDAKPDGVHKRTVANHTADLPVEIDVAYSFDGSTVENPKDIVGRTGELAVTYTVRNTTVQPTEIEVRGGRGDITTETVDVGVPLVGSLSLPLDGRFTNVRADDANIAGDGQGNSMLEFELVLFEPLGAFERTVSWSAHVTDAIVPEANAQVIPVDSDSYQILPDQMSRYADVNAAMEQLSGNGGAGRIGMVVTALANGSSELLDGMNQLADGTDALAEGLGTAASGSRDLADGTGQAAAGSRKLASGLGDLRDGAGQVADGTGQVAAGADKLTAGVRGKLLPGARKLEEAVNNDVLDGSETIEDTLYKVVAGIGSTRDGQDDGTVIGGLNALIAGLDGDLADGIDALVSMTGGLEDSFGPDEDGDHAGDKAVAAAAGAGRIADGGGGIAAGAGLLGAGIGGIQRQNGGLAAIGVDHLNYAEIKNTKVCLDAGETWPGGVPKKCVPPGLPFPENQELLVSLDQHLATLIAGATGLSQGGQAVEAGATELQAGLEAQAASLGDWPVSCDAAIEHVLVADATGGTPDGLAVFKAQSCIAESVQTGLQGLVLPGMNTLLSGINNPACDLDNPTDKKNPCGVRQVLSLLAAGSTSLTDGLRVVGGGLTDLTAGVGDVISGAGTLTAGARQLDAGANELAAGAGAAVDGGVALSDGLGQIDDGANQLADGLGDAQDGSEQIADGTGSARDGVVGIEGALGELDEFDMPRLLTGLDRAGLDSDGLLKQARAADDRAKAGDGLPYGTAEGANASAVYQFEIAGVGTEQGVSTPVRAGAALLAFGAVGALGMGVRRRLI